MMVAPVQAQESMPLARPPLLSEIQRARTLLTEALKHQQATTPPRSTNSREVPLEAILAFYNDHTSAIELVTIRKEKRRVTVLQGSSYDIVITRDNGVNSEFEVGGHPELHVISLAHPIFVNQGTTRRPRFLLQPVVYTPSSDYLATPEIVSAGEEYLDRNVALVYELLRRDALPSRAFPTQLLVDVVDPVVVKSIIAIEHMDAVALISGDPMYHLDVFHTILATNQDAAYAYARSSAQAFGLVQFIPSTYKRLVYIRADARLNPDFEKAMSTPLDAIKAQVVFLDYNLSLLPPKVRPQYEHNPRLVGAYLAAMYNGGPSRVLSAIRRWGSNWAKPHGASGVQLKRETIGYVKKYELVYEHFAGNVAQDKALVRSATLSN